MSAPVTSPYQQALDELRRENREPLLQQRMSELIALLELMGTPGSPRSRGQVLAAALQIVIRELQALRGALYVAEGRGRFRQRAASGLPAGAPPVLEHSASGAEPLAPAPAASAAGLVLVCPVHKDGRTIALIGLGPRAEGRPYGREELAFARSLAACAATPIENELVHDELRRVNESLSVKVFQLQNLFDIGRELNSSLDEEAVGRLLVTTVMGQFLASRCALFRLGADGSLELAQYRGLRPEESEPGLRGGGEILSAWHGGPSRVAELPSGPLRDHLLACRFALAVPLGAEGRCSGLLAVGEGPAARPYSEEDLDFAAALARQGQAALENARALRLRVDKERQDRELQIARQIQQSLFPRRVPQPPGFELAALNRSCHEVGGDYYDFIRLDAGRLALVVADVSGKGTPASIMMASVHASLQALAGSARPTQVLERLNRFVYENSQESRYVTLFYGELEPARRALVYVNAGHVPPYLLRKDGRQTRLRCGGPVIGLLEDVALEAGELLLEPGDLLGVVTDGVTEATGAGPEEFGDRRAVAALGAAAASGAQAALDSLVAAVDLWTGPAGCTDDLTVVTLRAT